MSSNLRLEFGLGGRGRKLGGPHRHRNDSEDSDSRSFLSARTTAEVRREARASTGGSLMRRVVEPEANRDTPPAAARFFLSRLRESSSRHHSSRSTRADDSDGWASVKSASRDSAAKTPPVPHRQQAVDARRLVARRNTLGSEYDLQRRMMGVRKRERMLRYKEHLLQALEQGKKIVWSDGGHGSHGGGGGGARSKSPASFNLDSFRRSSVVQDVSGAEARDNIDDASDVAEGDGDDDDGDDEIDDINDDDDDDDDDVVRDQYGFEILPEHVAAYTQFLETLVPHEMAQSARFSSALGQANDAGGDVAVIGALVDRGVPPNYRRVVFSLALDLESRRRLRPRRFAECSRSDGPPIAPRTLSDIRKDLHRSFPSVAERQPDFIERLDQVLRALARELAGSVDYVQGLNFLAGAFLLFLDTELAFHAVQALLEDFLPSYYSTPNMFGLLVDTMIFERLLQKHVPRLAAHFQRIALSPLLFTSQWFLVLFIRTLPGETAFRLWDRLLWNGPGVLFEMALHIMARCEPDLLLIDNDVECCVLLTEKTRGLFDFDELVSARSFPCPSRNQVRLWRKFYASQFTEDD